jgi:tetratricopeptide (TPR) repeat protein
MGLRIICLAATLAIGLNTPAHARWYVARSKHFIIYADEKPNRLAEFSTRLEKFDQAARILLRMDDPVIGDGNRVTVFVMPTAKDVQKLAGDSFLAGFYTGRVSGPLAYVAKRDDDSDLGSDTILFHEYAHHLMMQQLDQPYPQWYVEGFAEFLSVPVFGRDGSVGLGVAPQHRGWALFNAKPLPIEEIVGETYGDITKLTPEQRESIYGRGWLLTHYLTRETKRAGQFDRYIGAIASGSTAIAAARASFGDLAQLDKELNAYLRRNEIVGSKIGADRIHPAPIEVLPLTEAGAAVVLLRGRIKYGLKDAEARQALDQVRAIAARYPGDVLVETTLAEAELDGGNAAAAEAAADRAAKADPRNAEALVLKGRAMAERAEKLEDPARHDLFDKARETFIAANKLDVEDPEPLMEYYQAYVSEGVRPTDNAIAALHYASDLAPQDLGLRMNSAVAYLNEGKPKEARSTLVLVAYSPHAGTVAAMARRMIARIDANDPKGALMGAVAGATDEAKTP